MNNKVCALCDYTGDQTGACQDCQNHDNFDCQALVANVQVPVTWNEIKARLHVAAETIGD